MTPWGISLVNFIPARWMVYIQQQADFRRKRFVGGQCSLIWSSMIHEKSHVSYCKCICINSLNRVASQVKILKCLDNCCNHQCSTENDKHSDRVQ